MKPTRQQRVAIIVPNGLSSYGQGMARGVAAFARFHRRWQLIAMIGSNGSPQPAASFDVDGAVILRNDMNILKPGVPRVYVGAGCGDSTTGRVEGDNEQIGILVAEHLLDRGYPWLSFVGPQSDHIRHISFRRRVEQSPSAQYIEFPYEIGTHINDWDADIMMDMARLSAWIASIPKPIGIMAVHDVAARQVASAAKLAGCAVPEQVSIVGVDDNELICELSDPPLSSVDRGGYQAGYKAAEILLEMLQGGKPPAEPVVISPTGITVRRSSANIAIDDPDVAAAVSFIREHATKPIQVADILDAVPVARRSLERHFQSVLGRSIYAEIQRVRISHAKDLLCRTTIAIPKVAARSGFNSPERFSHAFKSATGFTPTAYRNRYASDGLNVQRPTES